MRILLLGLLTLMSCADFDQDLKLNETSHLIKIGKEKNRLEGLKASKLEPFGSKALFEEYVGKLKEVRPRYQPSNADAVSFAPSPAPSAAPESAADGITNNQESGVDEGGIIKTIGDYLVVLRRGRLFTLTLEENQAVMKDMVNAFPEAHSTQTWYDELLTFENKIIVVGYSYGYQATEIGEFLMDEKGRITHKATYFLRSNDYYSSRNYASRLVGNKLVFYMPYYFYHGDQITLPGQSKLLPSGKASEWRDIIDSSAIVMPIDETDYPVLHTIAQCDLSTPELSCQATSVVGPSSRTFYVSSDAVYLWISGEKEQASLYRLPLDGSAPKAVLAHGNPTDQFSFKQADDSLHVLLREYGEGDAMWNAEARAGSTSLLNVPLNSFSDEPAAVSESSFEALADVKGWTMNNRFVGDFIIYGSEGSWDRRALSLVAEPVHLYNYKLKTTTSIDLDHQVERIEAMGKNAVVIGARGNDLVFSSVALSDKAQVASTYVLKNSAQGEERSHGFYYKPSTEDADSGLIGLPIRKENTTSELFSSSASVFFLAVDDQFTPAGELSSSTLKDENDSCLASCVDWYGNSRPVFWRNRIFALLGYELVEGTLAEGMIKEVGRLNFAPVKTVDNRED